MVRFDSPVELSEMVPPRDYFGRAMAVGDHLAYAIRDGNVAVMRDGLITGFKWKRNPYQGGVECAIVMSTKCRSWGKGKGALRITHMWSPDRAVIMRQPTIGGDW